GVELCRTEAEVEARRDQLQGLTEATDGLFRFKMLDHQELAELVPAVGPHIAGASWCEMDGHVNPLKLLQALHRGAVLRGGAYIPDMSVESVKICTSGYCLEGQGQRIQGSRVVLAAGLGNRALAPQAGLKAPLSANRGQVIITERMRPVLDIPTAFVRQTG